MIANCARCRSCTLLEVNRPRFGASPLGFVASAAGSNTAPDSCRVMRHLLACGRCVQCSEQNAPEDAKNESPVFVGNLLPEGCQRQADFGRGWAGGGRQ